jgi:RNA polymerase sigma factor (sigma-70 family)
MANYSNDELLRGILRNNSAVLRYIYKSYYHKINAFVNWNNGNSQDANDVFQEAIIVIYRKVKEDKLIISDDCSFETYLFSVCRLLWLKQLQSRKESIVKLEDTEDFSETIYNDGLTEIIDKNERYKLYQDHFQKMGEECRKVLQLFFEKVPMKEITRIMGFSSDSYTKKRKHQCKEYLVKSIKQDTKFKKLIDYDF